MTRTLSVEQIRAMLGVMRSQKEQSIDEILFISLLLAGSKARTWTWESALQDWMNMPDAVYRHLRGYAIAKKLTIFPHAHFTNAHWIHGMEMKKPIFSAKRNEPYGTHEVTRRLKKWARRAGLSEGDVNLRSVVRTHHFLVEVFGSVDEAAEAVGLYPVQPRTETVQWKPLHGIGRRSAA